MKKLILIFSVALLGSTAHAANQESHEAILTRAIQLESGILSKVDGIFITDDTIAPIKRYQMNLRTFLVGTLGPDKKRHPQYSYNGNLYTMQQLSQIETKQGSDDELRNLLRQIRSEFEKLSVEFRGIARGSKPLMASLVEESCSRRGRLNNSLLYVWSKTDEDAEERLFDEHVHTIRDLELFFVDLHNFLGDLIKSCPKAERQFQAKVAKYNEIKKYLPQLALSAEEQKLFLQQINHSLYGLSVEDINVSAVKKLYDEFKKTK